MSEGGGGQLSRGDEAEGEEPRGPSPPRNRSLWGLWHSPAQSYGPQQGADVELVQNCRTRSPPQSIGDHCGSGGQNWRKGTCPEPCWEELGRLLKGWRHLLVAHLPQGVCANEAFCPTDIKPGSSRANRRIFQTVSAQEAWSLPALG